MGTLQDIDAALQAFVSAPLEAAARGLLSVMDYSSAKTIALSGDPRNFAESLPGGEKLGGSKDAAFDRWREVRFLFQLTNDEIPILGRGSASPTREESFGKSIVDSFVFLVIGLEGDAWKRTELAKITRAVNALFPMPVIIIFRYGGFVSLAVSERRPHKRDASRDVQTGLISIVLNIDVAKPHAGHRRILQSLSIDEIRASGRRPSNFDELYHGWQEALSTKTLNERFYKELSYWFFWALPQVKFPDGAGDKTEVPLIRLLTRLIFCWFVREKHLIPDALFRRGELAELLKGDPAERPEDGDYYKAILQNLFFATLNTEMGEGRKWRSKNTSGGQDGQHLIHSVYRYQDLFARPDQALVEFRKVPFLNGGLFECLDREVTEKELDRDPGLRSRVPDGKRLRVDGYSDHSKNPLHIPNGIFFSDEVDANLNSWFETKGKAYRTKGLLTLFEDYVFTVEENTSTEEEVALDPELLGKVFENLLASYNEETSTTARKKSGAFYTPRYVVDYMVRETLTHQFVRALMAARPANAGGMRPRAQALDFGPAAGELAIEQGASKPTPDHAREDFAGRVRALLDPTLEAPAFADAEVEALVAAIEEMKILDPACGSGAFPMGMLQALMRALARLDPDNVKWKARNRRPLEERLKNARNYDLTRRETEEEEAQAALAEFDAEFADKELADYVRKLHLIEKCLYGSDIQPIAILIAKLRFFISLAVEQKPHADRPNLGIKPLPNLETKLVAANSLVPLERPPQGDLFDNPRIGALERLIEDETQRHFGARTMRTKRKYRDRIQTYRDELSAILETEHSLKHDDAEKAAAWNPFDQNASAPFFDPLWMFQLHDGFDIVIGNPPYVKAGNIPMPKSELKSFYGRKDRHGEPLGSFEGNADYLVYFVERGIRLLKPGGAFGYITSNKWYRAKFGKNLRFWMSQNTNLLTIIDFGDARVFDAIAYPTIIIAERRVGAPKPGHRFLALNWQQVEKAVKERFWTYLDSAGFEMPQVALEKSAWQIEPTAKRDVLSRIASSGPRLSEFIDDRVYRGVTTGFNRAFELNADQAKAILTADRKYAQVILPYITGDDVERWITPETGNYIIFTRRGIDIQSFPAILKHLEKYRDLLEPEPANWTPPRSGAKWPGRKRGSYKWYEIQDNTAYWEKFIGPKIISTKISSRPTFSLDRTGAVIGNTGYLIDAGTDAPLLTIILNSPVSNYYSRQTFVGKQGGFYEVQPDGLANFCIPLRGRETILSRLDFSSAAPPPVLEQLLNGLVYELYFADDLKARGLALLAAAEAAGLDRLAGLEGVSLAEAATVFAREQLAPGARLRVMLSDLQTLDVVRIVEGKG